MTLYKEKFKIDSHRLKDWDYSSEALYFITIVAKDRKCIFGSIENEKMILNENGEIVENELLKSIKIRKNWFFHNWIVMPNHVHLLIEIQNSAEILTARDIVETHSCASTSGSTKIASNVAETHSCAPLQNQSLPKLSRKSNSISSFVALFKSVTTKQIQGTGSIWQSNYHDHIVRNYKTFETIYNYIKNNPISWETDSINSNFQ
jgi:REP element-mobilizing transposase RayT